MQFTISKIAALATILSSGAQAHSWVGQLQVEGSDILGFIRNYQGHNDATSMYRLEQTNLPVCAPFQQTEGQTGSKDGLDFPHLTAHSGDSIVATYKENGHISLPVNRDTSVVGDIYWYATDKKVMPTLEEVLSWPDEYVYGRIQPGYKLGQSNFDDGVCFENNDAEIPEGEERVKGQDCKNTFKLPDGLPVDKMLTVFWLWDFSGKVEPGTGHTEWYTSCIDIEIKEKVEEENREGLGDVGEVSAMAPGDGPEEGLEGPKEKEFPEEVLSNESSVHHKRELVKSAKFARALKA